MRLITLSQDFPARVLSGQKSAEWDDSGSEQPSQALRAETGVQDHVLLGGAERLVDGQVGPGLIG
jgi:hypothetical protein